MITYALTVIGQTLNRGIHQLSYIAKDAEGNTAKCDFRIHILSEYFYASVVSNHHSIFLLFYTLFLFYSSTWILAEGNRRKIQDFVTYMLSVC